MGRLGVKIYYKDYILQSLYLIVQKNWAFNLWEWPLVIEGRVRWVVEEFEIVHLFLSICPLYSPADGFYVNSLSLCVLLIDFETFLSPLVIARFLWLAHSTMRSWKSLNKLSLWMLIVCLITYALVMTFKVCSL